MELPELSQLKKAKNLSPSVLKLMSADDIIHLAKEGACPHYILKHPITNEIKYYFVNSQIHDWLKQNHIICEEGELGKTLTFYYFNKETMIPKAHQVPAELSAIQELCELPLKEINTPPGVYFLCYEKQIMYIGQSNHIAGRIITHIKEKAKKFDSVYFLPCHVRRLIEIETALIRHFRPKYNYNTHGYTTSQKTISSPTENDTAIIKEVLSIET